MSSVRSRVLRLILKRMIAPRFRAAGHSVEKLRSVANELTAGQRVPRGVAVTAVQVATAVPGEWLVPTGAEADAAVLYLHGGGLVMGSPATHRELAARIALACRCRVLSIEYRLAPEFPFPAAVLDTVAAYQWLLDQGIRATRISVGGDSGGGSLALQSAMALRDRGLPLPSSLFLMSPETDWLEFDGESYASNAHRDPWTTEEMCRFLASLYVGESAADRRCLSLATMDLSALPPMLIQVGDCEVLRSDSTRLADLARNAGIEVQLEVWPGMWHVFQSTASVVPEARKAIAHIGSFVRRQLSPV